jgi:predicted dehydrogenase
MKKIAVGILGYGGFGQFLHQSWNALDEIKVVAVADTQPILIPDGIRAYANCEELTNDHEVEIVAVATPPAMHVGHAILMMEAGKHLLLEKPAALSAVDGKKLLVARDKAGVVAGVNHMLRFHPVVQKLERWVSGDIFGPLRHASIENYAQDESLPPSHWFWDDTQSGGILIEHAVHFIDMIGLLTRGNVRRVNGAAASRSTGQRDRLLATVEYDDGLIATHFHQFSGLKSFEETHIRLTFDTLRLRLHGWIPLSGHVHALVDSQSLAVLRSLPNWNESRLLELRDGKSQSFRATGIKRSATHEVFGSFRMEKDKPTLYADCVRASLLDVVKAVGDRQHGLRVPLEAGVEAVRIAEIATHSIQ